MKQAFNIRYLEKSIGFENSAKVLSDAGFGLLDFSPKTKEETEMTAEIFAKYGLSVYQTHAPFNRYTKAPAEEHKSNVMAMLQRSAEMGAKYMVVHGDEFDFDGMEYSPEAALLYNYDYFAPVADEAAKLGIRVAFENVFEDIKGKPRFCSKAEDLAALIDRFGAEHVCACWDTGHAAVSFKEEQPSAIETVGARIECTHIHDNYLTGDTHLIPFIGKINWQECMSMIKSKTKVEVMSLELVYGKIPLSMASEYAKMLYKANQELINM